jgi:hypothetical protein
LSQPSAREEELTGLFDSGLHAVVDRLTGLLRLLESDWTPGFLLAHGRPIDGVEFVANDPKRTSRH